MKRNAMLTSLILLANENREIDVMEVYKLSLSKFNEKLHPNRFIELIENINSIVDLKIKIYSKNDSVFFNSRENVVSIINNFNFTKIGNYDSDLYDLFEFRENVELYLHSLNLHSEKREAMVTALIALVKDNKQVSYKDIVHFAQEKFGYELGKQSFNTFILELNEYSKSNIKISTRGISDIYYSELFELEKKINAYKFPKKKNIIFGEQKPTDTSIIQVDGTGKIKLNEMFHQFLNLHNIKLEDNLKTMSIADHHNKIFEATNNLLINHNLHTDKRASMLTALIILLKTEQLVDLEMIRNFSQKIFYGSLKSAGFNKFLNIFNKFSPSTIEISNQHYSCNDLMSLYDFIEAHKSDIIKLSDIIDAVSENHLEKEMNIIDETIMRKIESKDSSLEVGTALFTKIVKKYISNKIILRAASKLNFDTENKAIIIDTEMDKLYLVDFALNDLYFKITSKNYIKFNIKNNGLLDSSSNLIERYKLLIGVSKEEEKLIDSWISSKLSIFEITKVEPPLITVKDLLDYKNENLLVIDRNLSKSVECNMIWAFRLTKFEGLGATSGISFLFSSGHKNHLLKNWEKIVKRSIGKRKNHLLFAYLIKAQRDFGIEMRSEIFL